MGFLRRLFRAIRLVSVFAYGMVELVIKRPKTRPQRAAWLSVFCNRLLRIVKISFTHTGPIPMTGAVISNHMTYIDIMLHSALRPCVFVSKAELRKTPVLGWISMMSGTVYVQRGAGGSAQKAAEGMGKGFRDGLPVVFFPEGTTFVGDEPVMPFHSGLLAQALASGAEVTPAFLGYTLSSQDMANGKSTRNDVAWGSQTLPAHLWNLLGLNEIQASIHFAEKPIAFSPRAYENRKVAADEARAAVFQLSKDASGGSDSR